MFDSLLVEVVANLKVKLACLALLVAASLVASAFPAAATIVPQQGIGGAKLGMSKSTVRGQLGKPRKVTTGKNDFGNYTTYRYRHQITVMFQSGSAVTSVKTSSAAERTKDGIGVGSTEQSIKNAYPHITCRTLVKSRSCYLGELSPGQRVTDFQLREGTVRWVQVGLVID